MLKTIKRSPTPKIKLGPEHQGKRMSLKQFEPAEVQEGYLYELARGIVVVSDVPDYPHALQISVVRDELWEYKRTHLDLIHAILGTMECKLLVPEFSSERHPDLSIYLTPPIFKKGRKTWRNWIPDLVIEIVSASSKDRDYVEMREEYWALGVKEYWLIDAERGQIMVLRRGRNQWSEKTLKRDDVLETKLLPGFRLDCRTILDAGREQ